jgi:hypothetical protein
VIRPFPDEDELRNRPHNIIMKNLKQLKNLPEKIMGAADLKPD